jgi:hypothetical protein
MVDGNEAREYLDAAGADDEVVKAAVEPSAAHLEHPQTAPLGAISHGRLLEADDSMTEAVQAQIFRVVGEVVEEQGGAAALGEEMLQRQHLSPVAQRALGKQSDLREAVEYDPGGTEPFDLLHDEADGFPELEVGSVDDRLLTLGIETELRRDQLEYLDAVKIPAVGRGRVQQFLAAFGQGDVERRLAAVATLHQKLQAERGLSRTRRAFEKVDMAGGIAAAEDVIERLRSRRNRVGIAGRRIRFGHISVSLGRVHCLIAWSKSNHDQNVLNGCLPLAFRFAFCACVGKETTA